MKRDDSDRSQYLKPGVAGALVSVFISSPLTSLIVIASIILGGLALIFLPREEEPQIKVPMADVFVSMPGSSASEIEQRVTRPMEKLLWEIPGVEYLYSTSRPGESLVIVRFKVGEDVETSLVRLNQKLQGNFDRIPHGVAYPLIKLKSIDDVPILALTLHSQRADGMTLRRAAVELENSLKAIPDVAETNVIGSFPRKLRILLDSDKLAARSLTLIDVGPQLQAINRQLASGQIVNSNQEIIVETGAFLTSAADVANVVVGAYAGRPVYLGDVATIVDGAQVPDHYVFFGENARILSNMEEAVTISIAKRPGVNATHLSEQILKKIELLKGKYLPADIAIDVTRNYGATAAEKSDELLFHMFLAVLGVAVLMWLTLGFRESLVVAVAIPVTLALTLLVFYLYGYTLNRITLFALIFSIGILVDDAIVVVENIVRLRDLPENEGRSLRAVAIDAVSEVGNPTILATGAVIAAILPMAFVGGLMGPYMRPIPVGASAAMFFSLLVAFSVTPWAAVRIFSWGAKVHAASHDIREGIFTRAYRMVMTPLITNRVLTILFLVAISILLAMVCLLVPLEKVKVKMLPFDNKSEFQVVLNMPESSALEHTAMVTRELAKEIAKQPEVENYQLYIGTSSPYNFNGLVRHYFLRTGANVADIQVNLVGKEERNAQSHEIAKRLRPALNEIAKRYNARLSVAEVPPGPPVLQTLVAEIYGPTEEARNSLAQAVKQIMSETHGIVDIDSYIEDDKQVARFRVDRVKSAIHGITSEQIAKTLQVAAEGTSIDLLHEVREREDVNIVVELPQSSRQTVADLLSLKLRSANSPGESSALVPLRELVTVASDLREKSRYRKNLVPVAYVVADVAGEIESPVYAISELNKKIALLERSNFAGSLGQVEVFNSAMPFTDLEPAIKWDGEWQITIEVFRDLGLAFLVVLILIYILMVGWFSSYLTPILVMAAIPFSLVGILPAHAAMGAFFTATSMIGFMAGAGIVVRNSIILVDFIEQRRREGMPINQAVIDAGAVRFRPMMLTAMAVVVGAGVILFDPIFQGLAISLIAGEVASLLISRMAVPVLYALFNKNQARTGLT